MSKSQVVVVSNCSATKTQAPILHKDAFADAWIDSDGRAQAGRQFINAPRVAAKDLYAGREHLIIKQAIGAARAKGVSVAWYIVSAGYGVVKETDQLLPYDQSFVNMPQATKRDVAARLSISAHLLVVLEAAPHCAPGAECSHDHALVALAADYLEAAQLRERAGDGKLSRVHLYGPESYRGDWEKRTQLGHFEPATTEAASREGAGLVWLRGAMLSKRLGSL